MVFTCYRYTETRSGLESLYLFLFAESHLTSIPHLVSNFGQSSLTMKKIVIVKLMGSLVLQIYDVKVHVGKIFNCTIKTKYIVRCLFLPCNVDNTIVTVYTVCKTVMIVTYFSWAFHMCVHIKHSYRTRYLRDKHCKNGLFQI